MDYQNLSLIIIFYRYKIKLYFTHDLHSFLSSFNQVKTSILLSLYVKIIAYANVSICINVPWCNFVKSVDMFNKTMLSQLKMFIFKQKSTFLFLMKIIVLGLSLTLKIDGGKLNL